MPANALENVFDAFKLYTSEKKTGSKLLAKLFY